MNFPMAITNMLQAIGTLLVYVAASLALVLSVIICAVIAELTSKHAKRVRANGIRFGSPEGISSAVRHDTRVPTGPHRTFQHET